MTEVSSDPKDEYKIVNDNLHWYSNVRLAQLTLFFAILAVLSGRVFGADAEKLSPAFILSMKVGGLLATALFWYLEHRADQFWSHFMKRGVQLEAILNYKQFMDRPKARPRTTTAIKWFFFVIALFWLATIFLGPQFSAPIKVSPAT
ncbi:MAG: hypothetical protein H6P99_742 [Holophagaceae bacterium]|nr:hypothetical protein [Holophagaceae bacterium]